MQPNEPARMARHLLLTCFLLAFTAGLLPQARTASLPLTCQLIWGTDGVKPANAKCKELEAPLKRRLSRVFKWKNYYEIRRKEIAIDGSEVQKVQMSDQCLLEISLPEPDTLEVKLIGEGRLTKTTRQPTKALRSGELLVLAGDAKDSREDAWFVVLSVPRPKSAKESDKPEAKEE